MVKYTVNTILKDPQNVRQLARCLNVKDISVTAFIDVFKVIYLSSTIIT